ncbi:MAG: CDP-alcohol phosphatidyltransferase family protein [Rhizobiaceae bacterium]
MSEPQDRRPLKSRGTKWAASLTTWLAKTSVTPNQISIASMVFGACAGLSLWATLHTTGITQVLLFVSAAAYCQLRLLCNLLDGMVAVEAGKGSPDGAFWNEFPDRISDILILVGAGLAASNLTLGWAAAALAVLTAYIRELGKNCGAPADYSGPMAKPQRMAVITVAAVLACFEPLVHDGDIVITIALWIITLGCVVTSLRRAQRILIHLGTVVG